MSPEERQAATEGRHEVGKKAYRKPSVQVYGTLTEVTEAGPHNAPSNNDGVFPGWHTRT